MWIVHSYDFFQKTRNFLLGVRPLDMASVEQLRDDSWYMVCAALCHMALVFAIKHLYNIFLFCIIFIHSFFILFFNLILIN